VEDNKISRSISDPRISIHVSEVPLEELNENANDVSEVIKTSPLGHQGQCNRINALGHSFSNNSLDQTDHQGKLPHMDQSVTNNSIHS
jgi:hypothetical protein